MPAILSTRSEVLTVTGGVFSRFLHDQKTLALTLTVTAWAAGVMGAAGLIPPAPLSEFRGLWIASVGNIDWPSKPGLTTAQQRQELVALLDKAVEVRLNAVILQIRPSCDALYSSTLEPWSEYLTGQMGQAPQPFYDPLNFAVTEAHRRGLELHAWFNPFRVRHASAKGPVSADHVSRTHAGWVRQYGGYLWLDPGDRAAREHSISIISDVVRRYNIDGVHIDDYFYPYPEKAADGRPIPFPDGPTWTRYRSRGGSLERDDWRRENVNIFVRELYSTVKSAKPWVKVGISPFGIWRPGNPPQIKGKDAYDEIFADSRKWFQEGCLDYLSPQLYWPVGEVEHSFPVLLKWWAGQNGKGRHLWPGLNAARAGNWGADEITSQILLTRRQPGADGVILWGAKDLLRNTASLGNALVRGAYPEPALVPPSPWLGAGTPGQPSVAIARMDQKGVVVWKAGEGETPWLWVVQQRSGGQWSTEVLPADRLATSLRGSTEAPPQAVTVTAVSRTGVVGPTGQVNPQ